MAPTENCVLWEGPFTPQGYPRSGSRQLHVEACERANGPRPEGAHVRHLCGVKACLKHVAWGTRSENEQDKVAHGTSNHGSRNGKAKLTEADVPVIRSRRQAGELYQQIAEDYGVTRQLISLICRGERWAWL